MRPMGVSPDEIVCVCVFFPIPFIMFAFLVLFLPNRNSDPGPHGGCFSAFLTTVYTCRAFLEELSTSLVVSRRSGPTHAVVSALGSWCHKREQKTPYRDSTPKTQGD